MILGTLAGLALARFGSFKGRTLLSGMTTAPLVMPEVITGLSLLLLFVAMEQAFGWPQGRGVTTITIAHITFTHGLRHRHRAVAPVDARRFARRGGDGPRRAPGEGLLRDHAADHRAALISGWLLAFTLSLDDLVITSFVSGPGSSTLPMVIFSKVRLGVSPEINALATIMVLLVTIGIVGSAAVDAAPGKRRQRDIQMAQAANE